MLFTSFLFVGEFLSTLSLRRATLRPPYFRGRQKISIHALLAESDDMWRLAAMRLDISIHALLAESDIHHPPAFHQLAISIHALLAESDPDFALQRMLVLGFLFTLSLRRATTIGLARYSRGSHFYPRSPCGERPGARCRVLSTLKFLSTLSLRRATQLRPVVLVELCISIHALLAESDGIALIRSGLGDIFLSTLSLRRATPRQRHGG